MLKILLRLTLSCSFSDHIMVIYCSFSSTAKLLGYDNDDILYSISFCLDEELIVLLSELIFVQCTTGYIFFPHVEYFTFRGMDTT